MNSTIVTGGSTLVASRISRYFGARLGTGAITLTVHDAAATASAAAGNQRDYMVQVASQPTYSYPVPGGDRQGVGMQSGLVTVMTSGGTAVIFYE